MIYRYSEFRAYLKDWYEAEKARRGRFTKGEVSRLLGLPNSRNYFSDLLGGRELSETFQERLISLLALDPEQARYFRALVESEQARLPERRESAWQVLRELRRPSRTVLDSHRLEYFRDWRHGAVRALLDTADYGDEPGRIGRQMRPRLRAAEVQASLELLERLQLIGRDGRGFWKPTDRSVTAPEDRNEALVLELQRQQLDLIGRQLLTKDAPPRRVATNVVTVSAACYRQILERMDRFRAEIRAMVHDDLEPIEQACQIVLAAVPLNAPKAQP